MYDKNPIQTFKPLFVCVLKLKVLKLVCEAIKHL